MMRRLTSAPNPYASRFLIHLPEIARSFGAKAVADSVVSRQIGARLCCGDDVVGGDGVGGMGQLDVDQLGASGAKNFERAVETAADRRVDALFEHSSRHSELEPADVSRQRADVIGDRLLRCRRIARIRTGEHREHQRRVICGSGQRADLIERRRKRDQAVPGYTPVGRLQAGDAAQ